MAASKRTLLSGSPALFSTAGGAGHGSCGGPVGPVSVHGCKG